MSHLRSHIIRSLNLEVEFQDSADAFELRNALTNVCKTELLPALEHLFDEKSNLGKIIYAEKIVIDLGVIDKEGWSQALVEQVIAQLMMHFSQAASFLNKTNVSQKVTNNIQALGKTASGNNITEISEEDNIIESIFYFLKTGLLPWYTVIKSRGEFLQQFRRLIQHSGFYEQLLTVVRKDEHVLTRLIDQTPDDIIETILILSRVEASDIKVLVNCWTEILKQCGISHVTARYSVYRAAVLVVSEKPLKEAFSDQVIRSILQRLEAVNAKKILELFHRSIQAFDPISTAKEDERKMIRSIGQRLKELKPEEKNAVIKEDKFKKTNRHAEGRHDDAESTANGVSPDVRKLGNDSSSEHNAKSYSARKNTIRNIAESIEDGFYIANAGLVILNPFLIPLFENVGYLENKKWISENHQQRAILLTQYLITGKQEYPEFDLLLNKILTGYPLENSLLADRSLSDFEMKEGQDVLQSIIRHWTALKNTSIAGLQATFLQREGKLLYSDERWLLQIEQQTVDILLNKLPWGLSIIRLPWMENRLHVEWN